MKKQLLLSVGVLIISTQSFTGNININLYSSASQVSSTSNTITSFQHNIPATLLKELAHGSESFMNKNKLLIAAVAGAYAYGRTFMSVVQANHELARDNAWASWKAELSLDELKAQGQEVLTKELLLEIQKRHTNAEKPADALMPFITFLNSIDQEIANINHYRSLNFWIQSCHASWLFPLNERRFASASSRLDRLWFIKNLFLNWAAEYKLSTLAPRSALSTAKELYLYFMHKLNFSAQAENQLKPKESLLTLDRPVSEKTIRTKTLLITLAETACCAQAIALVGSIFSSSRPVNTLTHNLVTILI
jgi:hypothetical protein